MKKLISLAIIFYLILIEISLARQSIEDLKNSIIQKGAMPLIKTDVDDDSSYKKLLETQYKFILDEEIKIIKDIKIAENMCKIMGINDSAFKKKKFAKCVLEVWQARLIGKKFVSMQSEINTRDFTAEELQEYFNTKLDAFNEVRKEQLKKNKKFKKKFDDLGIKDKLNDVDYQKIVIYAIGIVAAYYIGKTILESLDEAKAAKEVAESSSKTAKYVNPSWRNFCNYGRMLYVRYRIRHGSLVYCNKIK